MILHVNLDIIDNNDDYLCFAWKLKPKHSFDDCLKRHSSEIHCNLSANNCFFHVMINESLWSWREGQKSFIKICMNFIVDYIDLDYQAYCSLASHWLLHLWCLCIWQTNGTWYPCIPQRPTCMLRLQAQSNSRGQTSPLTEESSVPLNLLMSLFDENEDLSPIDIYPPDIEDARS